MRKYVLIAGFRTGWLMSGLFCLLVVRGLAQSAVDHAAWSGLLKQYVDARGNVNYKGLIGEKARLQQYLKSLETADPEKLSREERMAFWINAYNALTVDLIVRHYPVKSILDIKNQAPGAREKTDAFSMVLPYRIRGKAYTLNQIEKEELLGKLFDPRIHFAINCASFSCPKLRNEAYVPARLEAQLNEQVRAFVNDPGRNVLSENKLRLSRIFDWYRKDFTRRGDLIAYLNQYAAKAVSPGATVTFAEYDWRLNEQ